MEKVKKYLSSFKNTLVFSFLPVLVVSTFYSENADEKMVFIAVATAVLIPIFIIILVTDIIAYRKANKELEED